MPAAIVGQNVTFSYDGSHTILDDLTFSIDEGEWTAILGANGSGKTSLVRLFNALLPLTSGTIEVFGMPVVQPKNHPLLRRIVGMVFQNPEEQCVAPVVEEDISFGLENYQIPEEEIEPRTEEALRNVGLAGFASRNMASLSGGQLQKVAIASVLALDPKILILDEATSMLDPTGRSDVMETLRFLHQKGTTIVMVTHLSEEAVYADRIIVLGDGVIKANGKPKEVLRDVRMLHENGLEPPLPVRLWKRLGIAGPAPLSDEDFAEGICALN
ncbi:MAG: ATP-binding cassette domain-containing protein [Sphaerochaetaceae bacterium]|jgi:energy-coupling factor transporter ATPase